ncbi:hypothetical protein [Acrocarpospora sp. B8E8]|uniref:hypothetical protein n=1 Tax=Acrocarpospora sp. B8E8 TaxID=3153572 RepID=UPI00325DFC88
MSGRQTPNSTATIPTTAISLKTGPGSLAVNHAYPRRTPVLGLVFAGVHVLLTTSAADHVTRDDLEFARCLAREAASFARTLERRFAEEISA